MEKLTPHPNWRSCRLNSKQCLSLQQILASFSAPISEAWAFAIAYEGSKALTNAAKALNGQAMMVQNARDLFVHKEGFVHQSSFENRPGKRASVATMSTESNNFSDIYFRFNTNANALRS